MAEDLAFGVGIPLLIAFDGLVGVVLASAFLWTAVHR